MIDVLVSKIVDFGIKSERIPVKQKDIYLYGYTVLIETLICTVCSMMIAVYFSKLVEVLLFSVTFILLRTFGGGYHANTRWNCILISTLMIAVFCILIECGTIIDQNLNFIILTSIGIAIAFLFAPQIKYRGEDIERRCRIATRTIYISGIIISVAMFLFSLQIYSMCILLAQVSWLLALIADLLKKESKYLSA